MKIITDIQRNDRIVRPLKQLGMVSVLNLKTSESAVRRKKEEEALEDRSERNLSMDIHQLKKNVDKAEKKEALK